VANSPAYTISITSLSPRYAQADSTIRVSGTLTNHSGQSASGLNIQLNTTSNVFSSTSAMKDYAAGAAFLPTAAGNAVQISGSVASGATVHWHASFTSAEVGYSQFGVYGLEAQAMSLAGSTIASEATFLPYWGGFKSDRMKIAWVWPLIDTPHQTACASTLTDDSLNSSLSSTGRLGTLLATGISYESSAHLTYAVDPALLSEAQTTTRSHETGGNANCSEATSQRASDTAKQWLQSLQTGTSGAAMFLTPYADVDVSALTHAGLDGDLQTAYTLGESVAQGILHRPFSKIGWPADGVADQSVLNNLASPGGVKTVVLDSSQMPLTGGSVASDGVASDTTGIGGTLQVALSDNSITSILGSASSRSAGGQFSAEQAYLAQTAMIAAEAPYSVRSIVVAPPRHWNPTSGVAGQLLTETINAPWLQSVSLSAASKPASGEIRAAVRDREVPGNELSTSYLNKVKQTAASVSRYRSIMSSPSTAFTQRMQAAVAGTESSAWRGNTDGGQSALDRLSAYISDSEKKITLIRVRKATLAGKSGTLPVSVYNGMDQAVHVRVVASSSRGQLSVADGGLVTVQPNKVAIVHLALSSLQIGTTQIQLQLVTRDGSPLPGTAESVSVVSTLYGRAVLVLIIVALAIVVLTSATRWVRRWLADGRPAGGGEHSGGGPHAGRDEGSGGDG
jgi:hypothetical protein